MKEVRSRRKRNYEEPDACHLDKLTYEQVKRVPVKGDVFILNLRCEGGPTGLYREVTEIRVATEWWMIATLDLLYAMSSAMKD